MTDHNREPCKEALSEVQQRFVDAVDKLATAPADPSKYERVSEPKLLFPGIFLFAFVGQFDEGGKFYGAEATLYPDEAEGNLEELWVDISEARTTYQAAEGHVPFDYPVPDEVIESFMQRNCLLE